MMRQNRSIRAIFDYIQFQPQATVPALAAHLQLPATTVIGLLKRLEKGGLLTRGKRISTLRGRPVQGYHLRLPAPVAACQIEATCISAAVFDPQLHCLAMDQVEMTVPLPASSARTHADKLLRSLIKRAGLSPRQILATALSFNAVAIDHRSLTSSTLPWTSEELSEGFKNLADIPAHLILKPYVLAEHQKLLKPASMCMFRVGDGVSSHLIEAQRAIDGRHAMAGELGHVTVDPEGPLCGCGRRGCLEAFCSAGAIIRSTLAGLQQGVHSQLSRKQLETVTPRKAVQLIFDAWSDGDSLARAVMEPVLDRLAWGLGLVVNLFDPEYIIAGGYVLQHRQPWIDEIARRSQRWILHPGKRPLQILSATASMEDVLRALAGALHPLTLAYPFANTGAARRTARGARGADSH